MEILKNRRFVNGGYIEALQDFKSELPLEEQLDFDVKYQEKINNFINNCIKLEENIENNKYLELSNPEPYLQKMCCNQVEKGRMLLYVRNKEHLFFLLDGYKGQYPSLEVSVIDTIDLNAGQLVSLFISIRDNMGTKLKGRELEIFESSIYQTEGIKGAKSQNYVNTIDIFRKHNLSHTKHIDVLKLLVNVDNKYEIIDNKLLIYYNQDELIDMGNILQGRGNGDLKWE